MGMGSGLLGREFSQRPGLIFRRMDASLELDGSMEVAIRYPTITW